MKKILTLVFLLLLAAGTALAQPGSYFNGITPTSSTFVSDLHALINPHTRITYDQFDETNVANFASRDTTNGQKVVTCVYSGENYVYNTPFTWGHFSREHTWCQSWMPTVNASGFTSLPEYSDQHHLFPVNQNNANDARSNHPEGNVVTATSTYLLCKLGTDASGHTVFEPRASHKGDAARALLYMSVCYNGVNGYDWTFNHLNNVTLPALSEAAEDPSVLLQWNKDDPPDAWEVSRNNYVQSIQGNRNPFVDHPEWVNYIDFNTLTKLSPSYATEPMNYPTSVSVGGATSGSITVSWTNAVAGSQAPSGYLLEIYASNDYFIPIDGSTYADDADVSDGRGVINVSNSGATSYQFTGLVCGTTYYVHVYSYNGTSTLINYKTDGTVPTANGSTGSASLATEPSKYSGGFSTQTPTITNSSITVKWSDSTGGTLPSGYILLANTSNSFTDPVDGSVYADDTFLSDGSAVVNIAYATPDSFQFTGLTSATTYAFKIYPYNGDGCQRNYKTANFPILTNNIMYTTTGSASSSPSVVVNKYFNATNQTTEWVELLVIEDNLDMRGMQVRDFSSAGNTQSPVTFSNNSLWSSIPKGTFVVLLGKGNTQAQDSDITDKKLIISDTSSRYFSGSASGFDIAGTADAVEVLTSGSTHIHSLSHGSKPGNIGSLPSPTANSTGALSSNNVVQFINVSAISDFGLDSKTGKSATATQAAANDASEQDFISSGLPVELTSFSAVSSGITVRLDWATATEVENYGFEIERRPTMINDQLSINNWTKVGFVQGAGTSTRPREYQFTDRGLSSGRYLYRLKQIDRDGNFKYSGSVETVVGLMPASFSLGQNFPNPFNPQTAFEFTVPVTGFATLKLYNLLGEEVETLVNEKVEAGSIHRLNFNASALASGLYFYTLRSGSFSETKKMVVVK